MADEVSGHCGQMYLISEKELQEIGHSYATDISKVKPARQRCELLHAIRARPAQQAPAAEAVFVGIHCPLCGYHQVVSLGDWLFQSSEMGHGYMCGSGKCPSHTRMILCEKYKDNPCAQAQQQPPDALAMLEERLTKTWDEGMDLAGNDLEEWQDTHSFSLMYIKSEIEHVRAQLRQREQREAGGRGK